MHGAFCDQPWPGNDAGDGPGLSRTVGGGDTRRTQLIPCACTMFCFVGLLSAIREFNFSVFCRGGKKSAKRDIKSCNSLNFHENAKQKTVNNDPKQQYVQPSLLFCKYVHSVRRRTAGLANQVLWVAKQVWQNMLLLYVLQDLSYIMGID